MFRYVFVLLMIVLGCNMLSIAPAYAADNAKETLQFVDNQAKSINTIEGNDGDIKALIELAIKIALAFCGMIAVAFIIAGGYQYITSAGNQETSKKAGQTITYAIVGLIIVLAAYLIINTVLNALSGQYTGG